MKAVVVERPGVLKVTQVPEPKVGEHDLLVKVHAASICNATDNHILNGTFKSGHDFYPQILGHEVCGEVIAGGSSVREKPVGKRIVFYTPRGGFCEYTTVDTSGLPYACIPDNVSSEEGSLCEMFHGAFLHTVYPSGIQAGEKVAVIGQGPMGLVVTQCLKAMAACTVGVIDYQPFRLEKAKTLGADQTYDRSQLSAGQIAQKMKEEIGPVDLAIVCTDTKIAEEEDVYDFAVRLLRPRGRLTGLTVAVKAGGQHVDVGRLFEKHINLRRRQVEIYSTDPAQKVAQEREIFQLGVDWVAQGKINMKDLITHRIPLEEIEYGLYLCREKPAETIKVAVHIAGA
jgi:threonine dehydrogenase-like Zn-dependent dehydrogenase